MIRALDTRLIAAHQWVVDLTQRSPAWHGRQCAVALGIVAVVRAALFDGFIWWLVVSLLAVGLLFVMACVPALYAVAHPGTRVVFVTFTLVRLLAMAVLAAYGEPLSPLGFLGLLTDLLLTAYAYFAACHPPRPRVPRTSPRLAHGGAS